MVYIRLQEHASACWICSGGCTYTRTVSYYQDREISDSLSVYTMSDKGLTIVMGDDY